MSKESDFMSDRLFQAVPDIHAQLEEKYSYQKELRRRYEAMEKPSDILDFRMPTENWWTDPYGIDPEYQRRRLQKQINGYSKR